MAREIVSKGKGKLVAPSVWKLGTCGRRGLRHVQDRFRMYAVLNQAYLRI